MKTWRLGLFTILCLALYLYLLSTTRFIAWPEMLVWPYLTTHGLHYYTQIITVYPPLLLSLLHQIASLYWSVTVLKLFTYCLLTFTTLLVGFVSFRYTRSILRTLITLAFFIAWQLIFEGNGVWFDHLLSPLFLLTFYYFHLHRYALAGFWFALALLTKQTSIYLFPPLLLSHLFIHSPSRLSIKTILSSFSRFIFPSLSIFSLGILLLVPFSHINAFFQVVYQIGVLHLPSHPGQIQWPTLNQSLLALTPLLTALTIFLYHFKYISANPTPPLPKTRPNTAKSFPLTHFRLSVLITVWALFASLGAFTRFELFHLQPTLPFLSLLLAVNLTSCPQTKRRSCHHLPVSAPPPLLALLALLNLSLFSRYLIHNYQKPPRFLEPDLMTLSTQIGLFVQNQTIYTYNTWDHFYFLLDQPPAVNIIYPNVPMFLDYPGFQDATRLQLTQHQPVYILTQHQAYSASTIDEFVQSSYHLVWERHPYLLWQLNSQTDTSP